MTGRKHSGTLSASMLYLLAIAMFVAACIIVVGYAGREPRDDQEALRSKKP
jgi:hypothetical protein